MSNKPKNEALIKLLKQHYPNANSKYIAQLSYKVKKKMNGLCQWGGCVTPTAKNFCEDHARRIAHKNSVNRTDLNKTLNNKSDDQTQK